MPEAQLSPNASPRPDDPADQVLAKASLVVRTGLPCFSAVVWLLGRSEPHRNWLISDLDRYVIPPLVLNQAWLFLREQKPVGFFSWANLTLEAERGLIDGTRPIHPDDWNAGDRRWSMDCIAPFGDLRAIFSYKKAMGFPNGSGRYLRLDARGRIKRVHTF
ncbi:MAG: toxin-activating lysine-acyltransferase [Geminicoccaceae bacterium]